MSINNSEKIRLPAEILYAAEIEELKKNEKYKIPEGWQMSPRSVLDFIIGGKSGKLEITPKYIGNKRLVEIAVATLVTDRALLLIGEPGTAKSWLSENLAAAVHGDSNKVVQGTAGTNEEHVKYSWNYAMLLANGPTESALVKSPIYRAMETGTIARFEEISRCSSVVQDSLISTLSEKNIAIPELGKEHYAKKGFSLIATANTRDRGVNEMSAALKRRFNIVVLPAPPDIKTEMDIVRRRVMELSANYKLGAEMPADELIEKVVTVFRELRNGITVDGKEKIKSPGGTISTAEAISLLTGSMALAESFGDGVVKASDVAAGLQSAVLKDDDKNRIAWNEYIENVLKNRGEKWRELYRACVELNN